MPVIRSVESWISTKSVDAYSPRNEYIVASCTVVHHSVCGTNVRAKIDILVWMQWHALSILSALLDDKTALMWGVLLPPTYYVAVRKMAQYNIQKKCMLYVQGVHEGVPPGDAVLYLSWEKDDTPLLQESQRSYRVIDRIRHQFPRSMASNLKPHRANAQMVALVVGFVFGLWVVRDIPTFYFTAVSAVCCNSTHGFRSWVNVRYKYCTNV